MIYVLRHFIVVLALVLLHTITVLAQGTTVTLSGVLRDKTTAAPLSFARIMLRTASDSTNAGGALTTQDGRFRMSGVKSGLYVLSVSYIGYRTISRSILVGKLSQFLDLGTIELEPEAKKIGEITVTAEQDAVSPKMDKKVFSVENNISQTGGSVLQAMKNLPGITVDQSGKVLLRGSDKVAVLIDGKQTALTGFGNQAGLDNIPASAIEKIEIIANPSAKYDANGNAGIINIVYKQNKQEGFNGKAGLIAGLGALIQKRENLPDIRPQYQATYKVNPSLSLNYRESSVNAFFQGDALWQKALKKNEFIERVYDDGRRINEQFLENNTQAALTFKGGLDWQVSNDDALTVSALFYREGHIDRGDLPYDNAVTVQRQRLWVYYEDEVNTSVNASASFLHKFEQPGHTLGVNFNYTFHREDEKFDFSNTLFINGSAGQTRRTSFDTTALIADENVSDLNIEYVRPLETGRIEVGTKLRWRYIPTRMVFSPGENSTLDLTAAGSATYNEIISALYGNYVFESKFVEVEAGLRMEYVNVGYAIDPNQRIYKSDGYAYLQPFPSVRAAYIIDERNKISLFYNRRVDRPDEPDLRIFPKYDDPEILKTGNPTLRPQFTQTIEAGYKTTWEQGYVYAAAYHRITNNILTRILTTTPGNTLINSITQNAGDGFNTGVEVIWNQDVEKWLSFSIALNGYQNTISAFSILNTYPFNTPFSTDEETAYSGNAKLNATFHIAEGIDVQFTGVYLAPDVIPQGRIDARYAVDIGAKASIQNGKGELFLNVSDLLNTMQIRKNLQSTGFRVLSADLYETQVIRIGYSYKF
ncbi:MAG: TonB-dependent receptor [Ignavibacteria bacterium]|nr:TonB-dependent receptor [Ignavibacteria bacterium]